MKKFRDLGQIDYNGNIKITAVLSENSIRPGFA